MPGYKMLISLGGVEIGVTGMIGVTGVVALGVPSKTDFGVPNGSMFTVFFPNSPIPKP